MPELPEVETIKRDLESKVKKRLIKSINIFEGSERLFIKKDINFFSTALIGNKIDCLSRHGKYLIFSISNKKYLIVHLRMTGSISINPSNSPMAPYEKIRFNFDNNFSMSLMDIRKFATIDIYSNLVNFNQRIGPDSISHDFNPAFLKSKLVARKSSIKSALLDQSIAAGVGNIYADEACWDAGINPLQKAFLLNDDEINRLCASIKNVLFESINNRGTTINNYKDLLGNSGYHQTKVAVYGRVDKKCLRCSQKIIKTRVVGRSTFYCSKCQEL
ncbi:MAG: bifunctional DNA-formamidopyrimidine glycosylase/DNA-(apurinic or apyrimidinic site) lyase [Dehalococcoidia bacterium]|jgi:formamidopyrimidine-DNA glycosylase